MTELQIRLVQNINQWGSVLLPTWFLGVVFPDIAFQQWAEMCGLVWERVEVFGEKGKYIRFYRPRPRLEGELP